ncbi:hypothetical protein BGZ52_012076, partial [Haplosporangium bisporale]
SVRSSSAAVEYRGPPPPAFLLASFSLSTDSQERRFSLISSVERHEKRVESRCGSSLGPLSVLYLSGECDLDLDLDLDVERECER